MQNWSLTIVSAKQLSDMNFLEKFTHYRQEQGVLHASLSGLGRKVPVVWRMTGPWLTPRAFKRYVDRTAPSERLLNLGGGSHRIAGAFNVDIDPRADAFVDIRSSLPFPDHSFRSIFCEEVLEHIDQDSGFAMLKECYRILQPGGILRISTPDLGYFASRVSREDTTGADINLIFYGHGHRHIYSREALSDAMSGAGFDKVSFSKYKEGASLLGSLDSHADRFDHPPEISQYCEGVRTSNNA